MSWEAESWARQQRTGDPVTKAVLVGIANWMNPKGDECQVSMRRLAEEVEISVRTAQRHVQRLETLGLVEKSLARREDGGQGWNSFRFPTYSAPHVSRVDPPAKRRRPHDNVTHPHAILSPGEDDNLTPSPGDKMAGASASNRRGEGDNRVTPERGQGIEEPPFAPPAGGQDDDRPKRDRGTRIPADWMPPPIDSLPPAARAKARQWPVGAYASEGEAFRDYWMGEGRAGSRKLDWNRAWHNRISQVTASILRDAKAGVKFMPASDGPIVPPKALDASREGKAAKLIREHIVRLLGKGDYGAWIERSRLDVEGDRLTLVAPSEQASSYQRANFDGELRRAMNAVLGPDAELAFKHERPPA